MTYDDVEAVIARNDPAELVRVIRTLWGHIEMTKKPRKAKAVTTTWLTPAQVAWQQETGGTFPAGRAAKALAPLRERYTDAEIGDRLGYYLRTLKRRDELRFKSVERFAESIGEYDPHAPAFEDE